MGQSESRFSAAFFGADADDYTYEALKLFTASVQSHEPFQPGCKFEIMLCLVGGQGLASPPSSVCGTSNALDFLPLDRSGNRRFIPVMVYPEQAEGSHFGG